VPRRAAVRAWFAFAALTLALAGGCSLLVNRADSQCATQADCDAKFPGKGTVCDQGGCVTKSGVPPTPDANVPDTRPPPPATSCTTTQECLPDHQGINWMCRKSDNTCVSIVSQDCEPPVGPYTRDDVILIGALLPLSEPHSSIGQSLKDALRLAVNDFAGGLSPSTDAGSRRPLAIVWCDETNNIDRAAKHLRDDLKVPVIIGTAFSQTTLNVANDVTLDAGLLLFSGAAGSDLSSINDSGLVWRTMPSDKLQATAMVKTLQNVLEPKVRGLNGGQNIRVAIVHRADVYGNELEQELKSKLVINGLPATDPGNAGLFIDTDYSTPDAPGSHSTDEAIAAVTRQSSLPDVIILAGYTEAVALVGDIEGIWPGPRRPLYLLSNGMVARELLTTLTQNDDLRKRTIGTAPGTDQNVNQNMQSFVIHFRQTFKDAGSFPEAYAAANAYDALYVVAYGLSATRNSDLVGKDITAGLARILAPSPEAGAVDIGPSGIKGAFTLLESGNPITFRGVSGPLAFDLKKGDVTSDVQVWCAVHRQGTTELIFEASGLSYGPAGTASGAVDVNCSQ
jgi:branched-chain amino acid transport system substrate-binding protein